MIHNDIKGRLGEALVALLFERQGWTVKAIGVENLLTLEGRRIKDSKSSQAARDLPDFLAYCDEAGGVRPLFVEVKTRNRAPSQDELRRYLRFEGVLVAWVSPWGIRAAWVLKDGANLPLTADYKPIESIPSLFFDNELVKAFHEHAVRLHGLAVEPLSTTAFSRAAQR